MTDKAEIVHSTYMAMANGDLTPQKALGKLSMLNVIDTRIYSDGQSATSKQSFLSSLVAMVTLCMYTGWPNFMLMLFLCAWNRIALAILVVCGNLGASCAHYPPLRYDTFHIG